MKVPLLFIDIETVSQTNNYDELPERVKIQWARKSAFLKNDGERSAEDLYYDRAAIYAEFGKIVAIGLGYFNNDQKGQSSLRVTSVSSNNEKHLLENFLGLLLKFNDNKLQLCGHNSKEFDFPYLCRRLLINDFKLPYILDTSGKKPWEVNHIDTMEMWKFGDWKHYTSLDLLASIFGIESSKTGIDGSQIGKTYYEEKNLDKIAKYCMRDVAVTAQLYLRLNSQKSIEPENIVYL